jgi:hypothetical protein
LTGAIGVGSRINAYLRCLEHAAGSGAVVMSETALVCGGMIWIEGALPAAMLFAPETLWMLPGLSQSFGMFASVGSPPRTVAFASTWFFVGGFPTCYLQARATLIDQLLMASTLHFA